LALVRKKALYISRFCFIVRLKEIFDFQAFAYRKMSKYNVHSDISLLPLESLLLLRFTHPGAVTANMIIIAINIKTNKSKNFSIVNIFLRFVSSSE